MTAKRAIVAAGRWTWAHGGLLAALAAVTVGSYYLSRVLVLRRFAAQEVSVAPFVLKTKTYDYKNLTDGEVIVRTTEARRSDGTMVRLSTQFGPVGMSAGATSRQIDFADGRTVTLDDWVRAKTTWPPKSEQALNFRKAMLLHPPKTCVIPGETLIRSATILGQKATVVNFNPSPPVRIEVWKAPGLGCQVLQSKIERIQADGSAKLQAETRPVSLKLEEPDPNLFNVGADYAELKPSERIHEELRKLGINPNCDGCGAGKDLERQDRVYLGQQAQSK